MHSHTGPRKSNGRTVQLAQPDSKNYCVFVYLRLAVTVEPVTKVRNVHGKPSPLTRHQR